MEFNYRIPFFHLLRAEFWDNQSHLDQKAQKALENNKEDKTVLVSYHILLTQAKREKYLKFLCYNYAFSQPYDLAMLQENFSSFLFPYYIFSIRLHNEKGKAFILFLNYISKTIAVTSKGSVLFLFDFKPAGKSQVTLIAQPEENRFSLKQNGITLSFSAEVQRQSELIDMLLNYLHGKSGGYKQLRDDLYIPSGIILKHEVTKQHKMLVKSKRFMVLGSGQLMLFK